MLPDKTHSGAKKENGHEKEYRHERRRHSSGMHGGNDEEMKESPLTPLRIRSACGWCVCDLKMRSIVPAIGVSRDKGRVVQAISLRRLGRRIACLTLRARFTRIAHPRLPTAGPRFAVRQRMCYSDYGAQGRHPTKRSLHPASFIRALPTEIASFVLVQREWGSASQGDCNDGSNP